MKSLLNIIKYSDPEVVEILLLADLVFLGITVMEVSIFGTLLVAIALVHSYLLIRGKKKRKVRRLSALIIGIIFLFLGISVFSLDWHSTVYYTIQSIFSFWAFFRIKHELQLN